VRVEDEAASGCQLDERKRRSPVKLAAEEDYTLKSPCFSSALWQRAVLRFIVLSVAIRNRREPVWPSQDIAITNIAWCMA